MSKTAISVMLLTSWGQEPRKDGSVVYQEASASPDLDLSHLLVSNREIAPSRAHIMIPVCAEWDYRVDT